MRRFSLGVVFSLCLTGSAWAAPHLFLHDEEGNVNWRPNLDAALDQAKRAGKPILIELATEG